jgi:hypothetical protein
MKEEHFPDEKCAPHSEMSGSECREWCEIKWDSGRDSFDSEKSLERDTGIEYVKASSLNIQCGKTFDCKYKCILTIPNCLRNGM